MKFRNTLLVTLVVYSSGLLNAQLATPTVGYIRSSEGLARGVYGLEGNYVLGQSVLRSVQSASFSAQGALVTRSGSLTLLNADFTEVATLDCGESASIVHVDGSLTTAIAWLPASHRLAHWDGQSFQTLEASGLTSSAAVTSVKKLDKNTASVLVLSTDGMVSRYLLSLADGTLKSSGVIAGIGGNAFEDGSRVLSLADHKLTVSTQSGEPLKTFQLATDDLIIENASSDCLHLSSKSPERHWMLHTAENNFRLYELPYTDSDKTQSLRPDTEISK